MSIEHQMEFHIKILNYNISRASIRYLRLNETNLQNKIDKQFNIL